ncbi:MAG: hypothetical protein E6Q55_22060 [Mycolicibacterium mageritense]|nr:MAG: hypothetical protein E6Q55_22060 [Mycolicibacterium mageritense]
MERNSCCWIGRLWAGRSSSSERARQNAQLRSTATTTTTAARGAAQIDCAALGEHKLKAGGHVRQLTQ